MPQPALAAVVVAYSIELIKPAEFGEIRRVRHVEFRWALIAFMGVVLLGTLNGILVALLKMPPFVVTLGTLVNLNRIEDPQFAELYQRIDRLRGAITARTTEIEKLTAEREAYDRGTLVRGIATIGGAFVALIALIVILRAIL